MPDPTTAELTENMTTLNDSVKSVIGMLDKVTGYFTKMGQDASTSAQKVNAAKDTAGKVVDTLHKGAEEAKKALDGVAALFNSDLDSTMFGDIISNQIMSAKKSFEDLGNETDSTKVKLLSIGATAALLPKFQDFGKLTEYMTDMGEGATGLMDKFKNFPNAMKFLTDNSISKTALAGMEAFENTLKPAKEMEAFLLGYNAEMGTLGDLYGNLGNDLNRLPEQGAAVTSMFVNVGNATGMSVKQVAELASGFKNIPFNQNVNLELKDGVSQQMSVIQASLQVASGTGTKAKDVIASLNTEMLKFGTSPEKALENYAKLSSVSSNLHMPFDIVRGTIDKTASSFELLGNNTQATLNIMNRLAPSLREAGLGASGISTVIAGITTKMAGFTVEQRALLSAQSGGAGGLQGAFQLKADMQDGKSDQVFEKVRQALGEQFGNKIVNLNEAKTNESSAAQFQKQISLITEGPLKIAGSEDEAIKILDAFSKGLSPEGIKTGQDALTEAMQKGSDIQERNNSYLNTLNNNLSGMSFTGSAAAQEEYQKNLNQNPDNLSMQRVQRVLATQAAVRDNDASNSLAKPTTTQRAIQGLSNLKNDAETGINYAKNTVGFIKGELEKNGIIGNLMKPSESDQGPDTTGARETQSAVRAQAAPNRITQVRAAKPTEESKPQFNVAICQSCTKQISTEVFESMYVAKEGGKRTAAITGVDSL